MSKEEQGEPIIGVGAAFVLSLGVGLIFWVLVAMIALRLAA